MEKRLFIAFTLTLIFFVFWSNFGPKPVIQTIEPQKDIEISQPVQSVPISSTQVFDIEAQPELLPSVSIGEFVVTYSETGGYIKKISLGDDELPFQNIGVVLADKDKKYTAQVFGNKLEFKSLYGQRKTYIFDGYTLSITLESPRTSPMVLFSNFLNPSMLYQRYQEVFYSQNQEIKRSNPKKAKEASLDNVEFAGARDRYYCFSLLKGDYQLRWEEQNNIVSLSFESAPQQVALYIGPQSEKELKPYELDSVMYYGFFHGIAVVMVKLMHFLFSVTKNWGLSIICFAILIYFALFPFTSKSTKAMQRMQQIQPEMEELKAKHKDNPQKLQKETIELYRKYKINPLGGCLPLLFQFPIFISLYQALLRLVELKGAQFLWIKDLSLPDHFMKISTTPPFYINLLPIVIMCVGLIQQKITTGASSSSQQKSMGLFFAVFIGVIFYGFPSALVLYWLIQNILTLAYQSRISKARSEHA